MYLDRYTGDHTFTADQIYRGGNYPGIHFCGITYESQGHPFPNEMMPEELYIQETLPLGRKLLVLLQGKYGDLNDLAGRSIRIKRIDSNYFFYVDNNQIGIIRDAPDWDSVVMKQWERNDDEGYTDKDQAVFFGTTEEEINRLFSIRKKTKRLARPKKSVFPLRIQNNSLISYGAAISSSFNGSEEVADEYYGIEVSADNAEIAYTLRECTLFPLIKKNTVNSLYNALDRDNILTISDSPYPFLEEPFFKSITKKRNGTSDIYVWIKFENLGEGTFDSYYYAVSYRRDAIINTAIPLEPDFLRQIIYLSNLSTRLLLKENEQKNEDQQRQAVKTAIGSIMSRNMSHNLGSHYLYYSRKDLEEDQHTLYSLFSELHKAIETDKQLVNVSRLCGNGCADLGRVKKAVKDIVNPSDEESRKEAGRLIKIYFTRLAVAEINKSLEYSNEDINSVISAIFHKYYGLPCMFQDIQGLTKLYNENKVFIPYSFQATYEAQKLNIKEYWKALGGASHVIDFCKNRMNYIAAVVEDNKYPSMPVPFSSIIKELLLDDVQYNKRHIINNYYLGNIVRSEGYTRKPYTYYRNNDTISFKVEGDCEIDDIILSLPGGALSIHAFYNIIENFIRNSAKYQATERIDKLVFTLRYHKENDWVWFKLSDNKDDADTTYNQVVECISGLRFLNDDGTINQSNKGLKEMVLSYLWLISWSYPNNSLGDVLFRWDTENHEEYKPKILKSFIEEIVGGSERAVINFGRIDENGNVINKKGSLCLHFSLPLHKQSITINADDINTIDSIKASITNTDLVILDNPEVNVKDSFLFNHFPRVAVVRNSGDISPNIVLEDSINNRLGANIKDFSMKFGEFCESSTNQVIYEGHQNIHGFNKTEFAKNWEKVYFDSISGNNFTGLIKDIIINDDRIRLLAKESALTRITIIDERVFDGIEWINSDVFFEESVKKPFAGTQIEQDLRNIRVLNYFEKEPSNPNMKSVSEFGILYGNKFRKVGPLLEFENATHFLTIHLGLIEKMLKNSVFLEGDSYCGPRNGNPLSPDRVSRLMSKIKTVFFPKNTPFICIHSGRGGLSSELRQTELNDYPFIPYITLESLFNDSKFLLSSMFYSRIYQNTR